jgi:hypothetical protein
MTKRIELRLPLGKVEASEVEAEVDRLRISAATEEGRQARRVLITVVPLIIDGYRARLSDKKSGLTLNQELALLEGLRTAKNLWVGALEKGGWVYRRIRDDESSVLEALRCTMDDGARWARDAARDEEIAAFRPKLADLFGIVEASLSAERELASSGSGVPARGGKNNRHKAPSHWLARKALVLHGEVLTSLEPEITERRFVASMLKLAKAGTARAFLNVDLFKRMERVELASLINSAAQPGRGVACA